MSNENEQQKEKGPSRRSFFATGSAALAAAAITGIHADAQQRAQVLKAEHDHSSSDPGQENTALLHENPHSPPPQPPDFGDPLPIW